MINRNNNIIYIDMYATNLDRVTKLTLEEAIRRVVLAQGFFTSNEEFLKVQSIIARTL